MTLSVIYLHVDAIEYAVTASSVKEILGAKAWVPVPGARLELPGVFPWAGRAVAVLDLSELTEGSTNRAVRAPRSRTLLLETDDSVLAVPADSVSAVSTIPTDCLRSREFTTFSLCDQEILRDNAVIPLLNPRLLSTLSDTTSETDFR
jgi:chemotaxis signal transduction protein